MAEVVPELALLEELEEHVEDVGVGLLDLVEEDDAVGTPPDALREHAALVVADVAWRGADEAGRVVPLHEVRHVDAYHCLLGAE